MFTFLGAVKVECGSQFSVALTRSGSVFTWGKGDYHRLGHGNDDHVRRPKKVCFEFFSFHEFSEKYMLFIFKLFVCLFTKVAALQGKKVISIATGSLHCVACTDSGEVFTWGYNDEGQLGDASTNAIQRPMDLQYSGCMFNIL